MKGIGPIYYMLYAIYYTHIYITMVLNYINSN